MVKFYVMRILLPLKKKSWKKESVKAHSEDELETVTGRDKCWVMDTDGAVVVGPAPSPL